MKVILYVPPGGYFAERWAQGSTMPNLGILYIAALSRAGRDRHQGVPGDVSGTIAEDIEKQILEYQPDIVGITVTTEKPVRGLRIGASFQNACIRAR